MDEEPISLSTVDELLASIAQAQANIVKLKEELSDLPRRFAERFTEPSQRTTVAHALYWSVPEIPVTAIAEHLLGCKVHEVPSRIGGKEAEINCDRCGDPMVFMSRTSLMDALRKFRNNAPTWAEGFRVVCSSCQDTIFEHRRAEWEIYDRRQQARLNDLRSMPYRDYLRTPEWQERRARHLKSAGFRCQLCNFGGKRLDVHHRTYARRGQEYFKDLIVLCEACHEIFHAHNRVSSG
jgi:hypothetical protein